MQSFLKLIFLSSACFFLPCTCILGGVPVFHYPFFARVVTGTKFCGGTFVTSNAVVTAAHCLYLDKNDRWAYVDEIVILKRTGRAINRNPTVFQVERYRYHSSYDPKLSDPFPAFDLAVVKLRSNIDLSRPYNSVLTPCPRKMRHQQGLAIGAGLTRPDPVIHSEELREVRLYEYPECSQYFKSLQSKIHEKTQLCYGAVNNSLLPAGTLEGDDGGPMVFKNALSSKAICFFGVASFSSDVDSPSVFTNVGYFSRWLHANVFDSPSEPLFLKHPVKKL